MGFERWPWWLGDGIVLAAFAALTHFVVVPQVLRRIELGAAVAPEVSTGAAAVSAVARKQEREEKALEAKLQRLRRDVAAQPRFRPEESNAAESLRAIDAVTTALPAGLWLTQLEMARETRVLRIKGNVQQPVDVAHWMQRLRAAQLGSVALVKGDAAAGARGDVYEFELRLPAEGRR